MHKLNRRIRFSISPFLSGTNVYTESDSDELHDEGLSIFFELLVELSGDIDPDSGFVVNVTEIDKKVYQYVTPTLTKKISEDFKEGKHIGYARTIELLKLAAIGLKDKFGEAKLSKVGLLLNPLRRIEINCGEHKMIYLSEKFEFAATHKLWNNKFPPDRNVEMFGKCANPTGHGHNYTVEVTIAPPSSYGSAGVTNIGKVVEENLITLLDHKNLNEDVPHFAKSIPTVENISQFAWEKLVGKFGAAILHRVTVWETSKTSCSYEA